MASKAKSSKSDTPESGANLQGSELETGNTQVITHEGENGQTPKSGASKAPEGSAEGQAAPGGSETQGNGAAATRSSVNAGKGLNLRSGPHFSYPVLGVLPDGTGLMIHPLPGGAEVPGWAFVETPDGKFGWVMRDFIAEIQEG